MSNRKIVGNTVSTPLGGVLRKKQITVAELQSMVSNYNSHLGKIIQIVCKFTGLREDLNLTALNVTTTATPLLSGGYSVSETVTSNPQRLTEIPTNMVVNGIDIEPNKWICVAKPELTDGKWEGTRFIELSWDGETTVQVRQRLNGTAIQNYKISEPGLTITVEAYVNDAVYQKPINAVGLLSFSASPTLTQTEQLSSVSNTAITGENYVVHLSESSAYVRTDVWSYNVTNNTITSITGHPYDLTDETCDYYVIAE